MDYFESNSSADKENSSEFISIYSEFKQGGVSVSYVKRLKGSISALSSSSESLDDSYWIGSSGIFN